jgi:hypothetical protein
MAVITKSRIEDIKTASPESRNINSYRELPPKISFKTQIPVITNPIASKSISKEPTSCYTSSVVKAGLVFLSTIGAYYIAKTANIFSYFGWREKNTKSKDVNSEIVKVKISENALNIKTNSEIVRRANDPLVNQVTKNYETEDKAVKFEEMNIEEFKDFSNVKKENRGKRKAFGRRSISIQNPIPDQNAIVEKSFKLTIDGTNVFSSNSTLFLEVINIPPWLNVLFLNPNPTFKGSYGMLGYTQVVEISSYYAFVTNLNFPNSSLQIIDITDPSNPTFKGSYNAPNWATELTLSDNYVYLTCASSGLQIIDVNNPANPTFKGSYDTPEQAWGITVSENYAYIADQGSGLQIIDISDPSNPTFKGSYDTPGNAYEVVISGNYTYIADGNSGLQIINITDPTNPIFKGSYDTPGSAYEVKLAENYAYIADGNSGLQIIDINDPMNPTFKGSYNTPGYASGLFISENYAYVADGNSGLQIIDISDPANPTFKSSYSALDYAYEIVLSENYAYIASARSGLQIIAINSDKLKLIGVPNFAGTDKVDIKACNEMMECAYDSFDIFVKEHLSTDTDLSITLAIIGSIVGVCITCTTSLCLLLTIGGGIVILKQRRDRVFTDKKELQKLGTSDDKKIVVKEKLLQPIEKKNDIGEV